MSFEKDMANLGEFLEQVENSEGMVSSIFPNTGNPTVSISLGKNSGHVTKVKGFGILLRKKQVDN